MIGELFRDALPRVRTSKLARETLPAGDITKSGRVYSLPSYPQYLVTRRVQHVSDGNGAIDLAYDTATARPVVLKHLRKSKAASDEANIHRALSELEHANIVKCLEVLDDGENIIIVSEHCEGGDLVDRVPAGEGISPDLVLSYMAQLMDAIARIHDAGYAHGDVKIDNFCIARNGKLQLVDFGCSVRVSDLNGAVFRPGSSTISYTAPEVFSRRCKDPRSADIWAAGVVLVVLATGWLPWAVASSRSHSWLRHWRGEECDTFKNLPSDIRVIAHAMLKVDPADRTSAAEAHAMIMSASAARREGRN